MNDVRKKVLNAYPYLAVAIFVLVNIGILAAVFLPRPHLLKVSVLNIGQGDSILVQGPTGKTMLVDGGPDHSVLRDLSTELGPLNRHIDMLVETHPDSDHITGLIYAFQQYSISEFMSPGIPDSTLTSKELMDEVAKEPNIKKIVARRGMRLDLGGGAYADVLYPDRDMSKETETNDGSITMHVVYGKTSFMLTGDLPSPVEEWIIKLDGSTTQNPNGDGELKTNVLKAGHHGSKYSTGTPWLEALSPQTVAISVGLNNRYGHPSPEMISRVHAQGVKILKTEDAGTLGFVSDGTTIREHSEGI